MKIKLKTYCIATTLLTTWSICHTFYKHKNIYETLSSMANDEIYALILGNFVFMILLLFATAIKSFFFGQLSDDEIDTIFNQSKWSLMNSFLIITMFTEELNTSVILFITILMFAKIFHWIVAIRIDAITQHRNPGMHGKAKLAGFILILIISDMLWATFFSQTLNEGYEWGIQSIAIFEFSVLFLSAIYYAAKYYINILDVKYDGRWNKKPFCIFIVKTSFYILLIVLHVLFVFVVTINYGVPIYMLRDIYLLVHQTRNSFKKYFTYLKLLKAMDSNFPDVKGEDFKTIDRVCIICRDDMIVGKQLPCKHAFHFECLQSWFERQGLCPTCRSPIPLTHFSSRRRIQNRNNSGNSPYRNLNNTNLLQNEAREAVVSGEDCSPAEPSNNRRSNNPSPPLESNDKKDNELSSLVRSFKLLQEETKKSLGGNIRPTHPNNSPSNTNSKPKPTMAVIPIHLFEAQTLLLQTHVTEVSSYLKRMQSLLRRQLELQHELNLYVNKQQRQDVDEEPIQI